MREFNDLLDVSSKELGLAYKTYAAEKLEGHTELAHELTATTDEGMRTILDIYSGLTGEVNAIKDDDEEAFKKVGGVEDEVRDAQTSLKAFAQKAGSTFDSANLRRLVSRLSKRNLSRNGTFFSCEFIVK